MVPGPAASESSGNLLEMNVLWPHPNLQMETLGSRNLGLKKLPVVQTHENHWYMMGKAIGFGGRQFWVLLKVS